MVALLVSRWASVYLGETKREENSELTLKPSGHTNMQLQLYLMVQTGNFISAVAKLQPSWSTPGPR